VIQDQHFSSELVLLLAQMDSITKMVLANLVETVTLAMLTDVYHVAVDYSYLETFVLIALNVDLDFSQILPQAHVMLAYKIVSAVMELDNATNATVKLPSLLMTPELLLVLLNAQILTSKAMDTVSNAHQDANHVIFMEIVRFAR